MNIESTSTKLTQNSTSSGTASKPNSDVKFTDELNNLKSQEEQKSKQQTEETKKADTSENKDTNDAIDGLKNAVEEINKLNCTDENDDKNLKNTRDLDDKKIEVNSLIDNNMNIQEPLERLMPEMNNGMSFNSGAKPFSEFVKEENSIKSTSKELSEESAILSTMEENAAIANRNMMLQENTKTVTNGEGIKKVDTNTNIKIETIAKFDSVIVSKEDADFFINLVENGSINMHNIEHAEASSRVSKILADLLAKSMNENKPVRIDFDNNISVIIRISRDGKLSADFLPSSQVAEAYLKENLPLLKQRFDDNNIEYDELNQRKQKQDEPNDNRKKGRKDE